MREKNQETRADIIAEMRTRSREVKEAFGGRPDGVENMLDIWAERIEAAAKREKAQHGNAAAMREALKKWIAFGEWLLENAGKDKLGEAIRENGPIIRQRMEELRDALAKPPRQCDVGTAEEQAQRFHSQCFEYHTGRCSPHCRTLPAKTRQECALKWAQTPYAAQEGAGE